MRSGLLGALVAVSLCPVLYSAGAEPAPSRVKLPAVTANLEGVSLRRALATLFQGVDAKYVVDPEVPNVAITLRLKDMEFSTALRLVTQIAGATYAWEDGRCVIRMSRPGGPGPAPRAKPPAGPPPPPVPVEPKITLQLREVPFRVALEQLFGVTGGQYAVEPDVPNSPITVSLRDVDFTAALRRLVRLAGVTYRKEGPITVVMAREPAARVAPPAPAPVANKLTLDLRDLPFRQALELVFRGTGRQYAVEPDVPNVPIRVSLKDAGLEDAIGALARLAGAAWEQEGTLYVFKKRTAENAGEGARAMPVAGGAEGSSVTLRFDRISFRTALEALFSSVKAQYRIEADTPDTPITLQVLNVDFTTALRTLTRLGGAIYTREGPVYVVRARP